MIKKKSKKKKKNPKTPATIYSLHAEAKLSVFLESAPPPPPFPPVSFHHPQFTDKQTEVQRG